MGLIGAGKNILEEGKEEWEGGEAENDNQTGSYYIS
jgi:hypothetical protein